MKCVVEFYDIHMRKPDLRLEKCIVLNGDVENNQCNINAI